MLKAFFLLIPLAKHVWLQLVVSKFVLSGFQGKSSFQKRGQREM